MEVVPITVCQMEGVIVRRGHSSVWIETESWCNGDLFMEALRLLGVLGRTDYETIYDPGTGKETFIFDETTQEPPEPVPSGVHLADELGMAEGPLRVLRNLVVLGVLQGLPGVVPGDHGGRPERTRVGR